MSKDMEEYTEVVKAIQQDGLQNLLGQNTDFINKEFFSGMTVAHLVATSGKAKDIEYLSTKGANFNVLNDDKMSPLALAASSGNADMVDTLIKNGAAIEIEGQRQSVLVEAAFSGKDEIIDVLLESGAKMNLGNQTIDKNTLHAAALLKTVAAIEEASSKKDLKQFLSKIKSELSNRLGGGELSGKILEGIDNKDKRQEILANLPATDPQKAEAKIALIFCWDTVDEAVKKLPSISQEPTQEKKRSKLYQIAASVYSAVSRTFKKLASVFKQKVPAQVNEMEAVAQVAAKAAEQTERKELQQDAIPTSKRPHGHGPTGL